MLQFSYPHFVFAVFILITLEIRTGWCQVVSLGFCPKPPPMQKFDLTKYEGMWYEVEKYWFAVEALSTCVTVEYFDKGSNETFGVEISQMQGRKQVINPGTTVFNSKDGSADLILDLQIIQSPIPFTFRYPYLVLHTDYVSYTIKWACKQVGPLNFQNMWILSRDKSFSTKTRKHVYTILRSLGINTQMLKKSDLSSCISKYI